jgi:hypothetical protein
MPHGAKENCVEGSKLLNAVGGHHLVGLDVVSQPQSNGWHLH